MERASKTARSSPAARRRSPETDVLGDGCEVSPVDEHRTRGGATRAPLVPGHSGGIGSLRVDPRFPSAMARDGGMGPPPRPLRPPIPPTDHIRAISATGLVDGRLSHNHDLRVDASSGLSRVPAVYAA